MKKINIHLLALLLPVCFVNADSYYYFQDFQSIAVGNRPTDATYQSPANVVVVDDQGIDRYEDPFGVTGNRSLMLWDKDSGVPRIIWSSTSAGIPAMDTASYTFDFYHTPKDSGISGERDPRMAIYVGGQSDYTTRLLLYNGTVSFRDGSDTTMYVANNFTLLNDTAYTFRMEFTSGQYSLFIKEIGDIEFIQLTYNDGGIDKSIFDYANVNVSPSYIQFTTADGAGVYAPFYIDNLEISSVIPELSEIGLLVGIASLLLFFSKRYLEQNQDKVA